MVLMESIVTLVDHCLAINDENLDHLLRLSPMKFIVVCVWHWAKNGQSTAVNSINDESIIVSDRVTENSLQCFPDDLTCPQTSVGMFLVCFYWTQRQFSMNGFT